MKANLSSRFFSLGGLALVSSLPGGSKTELALSYLKKEETQEGYFLFASDEGLLYPLPLHEYPASKHFFSHVLIVKVNQSEEVWKVGLEGMQTGLFRFVFLRPSRPCQASFLRKLQLAAERTQSKVFLLSQDRLPHWTLRASFIARRPARETDFISTGYFGSYELLGNLSETDSEDFFTQSAGSVS